MAQDWIKMRTDLDTDPRVLRMAFALNLDVDFVVGKCWRFWKLGDTHTIDGVIRLMTPEVLDHTLRLPGFAAALQEVGWLEVTDAGVVIPRFDDHNSATAKARANDALRKANRRAQDDAAPPSDDPSADQSAGANPQRAGQSSPQDRPPTGRVSGECPESSGQSPDAAGTGGGPRRERERDENERFVKDEKTSPPGRKTRDPADDGEEPRFSLPTAVLDSLLDRIFEVTEEVRTRPLIALYRTRAETIGVAGIERAISATKDRKLDHRSGRLRRPGAYFNETCSKIAAQQAGERAA